MVTNEKSDQPESTQVAALRVNPVPDGRYLIAHPPKASFFDGTERSNVVGFVRKPGYWSRHILCGEARAVNRPDQIAAFDTAISHEGKPGRESTNASSIERGASRRNLKEVGSRVANSYAVEPLPVGTPLGPPTTGTE